VKGQKDEEKKNVIKEDECKFIFIVACL